MAIQVLNNSQLCAFRQCPHYWGLHYMDKLVPDRNKIDARFWGSMYHFGQEGLWGARTLAGAVENLEKYHRDAHAELDHDTDEKVDERRDAVDKALEETQWAMKHYVASVERELKEWVTLATEHKFRVIVSRGVHHEGTIDMLAFEPWTNRIISMDHKSTAVSVEAFEGRLQLDTQHVGYTFAAHDMCARGTLPRASELSMRGHDIRTLAHAFQWHVVRRKMPTVPVVNKLTKKAAELPFQKELLALQAEDGISRGMVSIRQIDTTAQMYMDALDEQIELRGLAVTPEQSNIAELLHAKGDTYFGMTETFVSPRRVERWKKEFLIDAKRIRAACRDLEMRTRNPSSCSLPGSMNCDYREKCINPEMQSGYRVDSTIIDPMEYREK